MNDPITLSPIKVDIYVAIIYVHAANVINCEHMYATETNSVDGMSITASEAASTTFTDINNFSLRNTK